MNRDAPEGLQTILPGNMPPDPGGLFSEDGEVIKRNTEAL